MKNSPYLFRKILTCVLFLATFKNGFAQQVEKGLTASNGTHIGFLEYKPSDYATSPTAKYPVIIFFHGIGERGNGTSELYKVKRAGIPRYIDKGHKMRFYWNGKWETFIVLSPQLDISYNNWQNYYGEAMLAYAKKNLRIDTNRVYMAGLSLGGGGVWSYASGSLQNAQKLAAIAPACGVCTMSNGCNIANADLPVWAEHATDDPTVGVSCTNNAITKIKNCAPSVAPIKIIYPTGGHSIWDRMFDTAYTWHDVNIYEWFLGQNKSLKPNILPVAKAAGNTNITLADASTTLNASGSSDTDGKLVRYIWKQLNGPHATVFQTARQASTAVSGLSILGKYQFELTVVDNRANWSKDTITVNVTNAAPVNKPPVADAGSDIKITLPDNTVTLDGRGSSDVEGSISLIEWSLISGPSAPSIARPGSLITDITELVKGTYKFRLTVTDEKGLKDSDTVNVVVFPVPNEAPIVKAGANKVIYLPIDSVYVAGSAIDLDGSISSYLWKQVSGPVQATFTNPDQWGTEIRNLAAGTYYFALFASDNEGATSSDTLVVTVKKAANQAPRITLTKTITIQLPVDSAMVSASGTFDPDGTIESYNWQYVSGPDSSIIQDAYAMKTWITGLKEGRYRFRLTVSDNLNEKVSDTLTIKVIAALNQPPIAIAGKNISLVLPENSITVDGSESTDPEGSSLTYQWSKIKGPAADSINIADAASTIISGLMEGVYYFQLQVTDKQGASALDTIRVTVKGPLNLAPDAQAGKNATILVTSTGAKLNGSQSSDADGTIVTYQWQKISGAPGETIANPNEAITLVTNLQVGTYLFELTVMDNDGASSKDTVQIKVNPKPINPPVAFAGNDFTVTLPADTVVVVASGSYDSDGTIKSYLWSLLSAPNQVSMSNSNTDRAALSKLIEGVYEIQLTVTDDDGAKAMDTVSITVLPAGNTKPVANAGADKSVNLPLTNTSLDGSKSYDPDGSIEAYKWTQLSGPVKLAFDNNEIANLILTELVPGDYNFRLTVTDDGGLISTDDIKLKVIKAPNKLPIANAGKDSIVSFGSDFQLNGSASFDPDGSISGYSWTKISGPGGVTVINSGLVNPMVTGVTGGRYVFRITVTDNEGAETSDDVVINAELSVNKAPLAYAGKDTVISYPASEVELDASGSMDFDGKIVNYVWNQVSGPDEAELLNATSGTTVASGMTVGTYQFELIVHDDDGAISRDTVAVNVVNNLRIIDNALAYPNPAVNQVTLKLNADETGITVIRVFDLHGRLISTTTTEKPEVIFQHTLSVKSLKPGLYLIQINIGNQKKMVTRLVKQ